MKISVDVLQQCVWVTWIHETLEAINIKRLGEFGRGRRILSIISNSTSISLQTSDNNLKHSSRMPNLKYAH